MSCFDAYIQNCNSELVSDFQAESNQVCEGLQVQFSDQSQGNILVWEWHFEGGTPEYSGEMNPLIAYNQPGIWNVSLKVSNDLFADSLTVQGFIEVTANPEVTLQPFDAVCDNVPPFLLTGGDPEGGTYSGNGVENGWFDPQVAGEGEHLITYTYEDEYGCYDFAEHFLVVELCTSLSEISAGYIEIYPNPTGGKLYVNAGLSGEAVIRLFDLLGAEVFETVRLLDENVPVSLDLQNLPAGLYLIQVTAGGQSTVRKFNIAR